MRLALETLPLAVRLQVVANLAQLAIAAALWLALVVGLIQVYVTRMIAKRQVAYTYFDRFTSEEIRTGISDARDFWEANDWAAFQGLSRSGRSELLVVPNLIEEVAHAYNRKQLDRGMAALVLGGLIERLWDDWQELVNRGRQWRGESVYYEWSRMQADTRTRRDREERKLQRRESWHNRAYGPPETNATTSTTP